jgi:HEAT repeat protein
MKRKLRELLVENRLAEIADMAEGKRRVLGALRSLTYDRDRLVGWRAVEAMGVVADHLADRDADAVVEELRSLFWLLSEESGGVCWHAPEAMAEIVRRRPEQFSSYISITATLINEMADEDLEHFRPGILWAIGRLGPIAAATIDDVLPAIEASLDQSDPQARGMAAWCLGQIGRADLLRSRADLLEDDDTVAFYEGGQLTQTTVAELAVRAL